MLTRKQFWRRTKSSRSGKNNGDLAESEESDFTLETEIVTIDPIVSPFTPKTTARLKSALSSNNLFSLFIDRKVDDRVLRFAKSVKVCLVQTREEFASLGTDLYWKPEDYGFFKADAVQEIRAYALKHGLTGAKALKQIYQPEYDRLEKIETFSVDEAKTDSADSSCEGSVESVDISRSEMEMSDDGSAGNVSYFSNVKTDVEIFNERAAVVGGDKVSLTKQKSGADQVWEVQWHKPKSLNVLVYEPNQDSSKLISSTLLNMGHKTIKMSRSDSICHSLRSNPNIYDVLLIDLSTPLMEGLQVIKAIRNLGARQRIIVMATVDMEHEESVKKLISGSGTNIHEVLFKPLDTVDLCRALS